MFIFTSRGDGIIKVREAGGIHFKGLRTVVYQILGNKWSEVYVFFDSGYLLIITITYFSKPV